jgi:hypothetical protein
LVQQIKTFFESNKKNSYVIAVRKRKGASISNRKQASNEYFFVEFLHETSVNHAMRLASTRRTNIGGTNFRIYKAGSGTYFCIFSLKIPHFSI